MQVTVHFDGGCRTKAGLAAGAAVVYDEVGSELMTRSHVLRETTTPVAEYTGLILGLTMARELRAKDVTAMGDAELIVRQVNGVYKCLKPHLIPLLAYVHTLQGMFESCVIVEFPKAGPQMKRRHGNARADELANAAMDAALTSSTST